MYLLLTATFGLIKPIKFLLVVHVGDEYDYVQRDFFLITTRKKTYV